MSSVRAATGAAKARPVRPLRFTGAVCASLRLPFDARSRGAFADALVFPAEKGTRGSARRAVPGGGDFCGDEKHKPGVGARSALRQLTRRSCPNVESAANAVSSATRPRGDAVRPGRMAVPADCHAPGARPCACKRKGRSEVGAQRRPPQHEPLPGTRPPRRAEVIRKRTPAKDSNGPKAEHRATRRG